MKTDVINALARQTVVWLREDLVKVLEDNGIEPTEENVSKFASSEQFNKLHDCLTQAGNEYLDFVVGEIFD